MGQLAHSHPARSPQHVEFAIFPNLSLNLLGTVRGGRKGLGRKDIAWECREYLPAIPA